MNWRPHDGHAKIVIRARPGGPVLWTSVAESVVQAVVGGDLGKGFRIYVARGRGRGRLDAPLSLDEIDPATGVRVELWTFAGGRNDVAHLSISDVDGDGRLDLAFAYFESKYGVRTRHLTATGQWLSGDAIRMGTERAWADLDGDGKSDAIIGRMYGDALGLDGDLRLVLGGGAVVPVDTDRGVRTLTVARLSGDAAPTLYFVDGWAARYAAEAKAQLKRVRFVRGERLVELVGLSPDEYTFNHLEPVTRNGGARAMKTTGLLVWGNRELSVFWPKPNLPWPRVVVSRDPQLLAGALVETGDGARIVVPGEVTRLVDIVL